MYIDTNLSKELNYFQKKYSYKIDFIEKAQFIIPEYKIELLNKSKKIIDKIENINSVNNIGSEVGKHSKTLKNEKKSQKVLSKKIKAGEIKKIRS